MTVIVFSVNREHVGSPVRFREILRQLGLHSGENWQGGVADQAALSSRVSWRRRARARGHYRGFVCGYPWRGETSRGG